METQLCRAGLSRAPQPVLATKRGSRRKKNRVLKSPSKKARRCHRSQDQHRPGLYRSMSIWDHNELPSPDVAGATTSNLSEIAGLPSPGIAGATSLANSIRMGSLDHRHLGASAELIVIIIIVKGQRIDARGSVVASWRQA